MAEVATHRPFSTVEEVVEQVRNLDIANRRRFAVSILTHMEQAIGKKTKMMKHDDVGGYVVGPIAEVYLHRIRLSGRRYNVVYRVVLEGGHEGFQELLPR